VACCDAATVSGGPWGAAAVVAVNVVLLTYVVSAVMEEGSFGMGGAGRAAGPGGVRTRSAVRED